MTEPGAAPLSRGLPALIALFAIGIVSLWHTLPRHAAPDSDTLATALAHVEAIAEAPHPPGTGAHQAVAAYLLTVFGNLGLEVEIQWADVIHDHPSRDEHHVRAARVQNILARLPGTDDRPALVLMSHYDSRPGGPGAADDAAGVAAVLEAARALSSGPPPARDVWFAITDGEELGLMGAQALFRQHPLKDQAGLVINFEARGSAGPSQLFETGPGNGSLIAEAARAMTPTGSSVAYEIYRFMPNDTDLTISKGEGLAGLNFAFVDGYFDYHTEGDTPEHLSRRSLAAHVETAIRLGRHFATIDTLPEAGPNHTFFNPVPGLFLHYGPGWAVALGMLSLLLTIGVIVRHRSAWGAGPLDILRSLIAVLMVMLVASNVLESGHDLIRQGAGWSDAHYWQLFYRYPNLMGGYALVVVAVTSALLAALARGLTTRECLAVPAALAVLALIAGRFHPSIYIGLALVAALMWWFRRPLGQGPLQAGALVLWMLLAALLGWRMPTAAFMAVVPLIWVAAWLLAADGRQGWQAVLAAVGPLMLWLPLLYGLYLVLGVELPHFPGLGLAAVLCLTAGLSVAIGAAAGGRLSLALAVAGIGTVVGAVSIPVFDARHRQPTELFLWHDVASGRNLWASGDGAVNDWTEGLLGNAPATLGRAVLVPESAGEVRVADWHGDPPEPARVSVIENRLEDGQRYLRLKVQSPIGADALRLWFQQPARIRGAALDGQPVPVPGAFEKDAIWRWRYDGLRPVGLRLDLIVDGPEPLRADLIEIVHDGLPEQVPPRPDTLMRRPYTLADTRLIRQPLILGGESPVDSPPSSGPPSAAPPDAGAPGSPD